VSDIEIRWNDEARAKILEDSDRVLSEAVLDLGTTMAGRPWEDAFAELNSRLKDRFIDFEPGPDLRKYAEAIANGDFGGSEPEASEPGTEPEAGSDTGSSTDAQGTRVAGEDASVSDG